MKASLCAFSLLLNWRNLSAIIKHTLGREGRSWVCGDDFNTILLQGVWYTEEKIAYTSLRG